MFRLATVARYAMVSFGITISISSWSGATEKPEALEGVGITERLGGQVAIHDLNFKDEQGKAVRLADYFKKDHPVILALVYYQCPRLCNLLLNGFLDSVKKLEWTTGGQFEVVAVSINPKETPELASKKKANYLEAYRRPGAEKGWHFLTGQEDQIQSLASQIGFKYRYDEKDKQYVHAAALYVLTPEGKISRYLYGINFHQKDLRLSLSEASNGKVGSVVDQVLLFCFHFDPARNSYTLRLWRVVQGILTIQVLALIAILYVLWRKDPDRVKKAG